VRYEMDWGGLREEGGILLLFGRNVVEGRKRRSSSPGSRHPARKPAASDHRRESRLRGAKEGKKMVF